MKNNQGWSKFLVTVAILEIIIAAIAASGLGVNILATTKGTADVIERQTELVVDTYDADLTMKIDQYYITGEQENTGQTDSSSYTYKQAYNDACGDDAPANNATMNCNLRYAVWQWTSTFTAMGMIACVIVFITGVVLLVFACCGDYIRHCLCGANEKNEDRCCRCLFSCTIELVLIVLNVLVFLLFAFSWAIIVGLKYADLDNVLANAAKEALDDESSLVRYDNFNFESLKAGDSLWPLAVASFLSLVVAFYLFFSWCCRCCNGGDTEKKSSPQRKSTNETELV